MSLLGNVAALKVSGERLFVLEDSPVKPSGEPGYLCRRVKVSEHGITHELELFGVDEVETIEENIIRELNENVLKGKLQKRIYSAAEKEMAQQEEAEAQVPSAAIEFAKKKPN